MIRIVNKMLSVVKVIDYWSCQAYSDETHLEPSGDVPLDHDVPDRLLPLQLDVVLEEPERLIMMKRIRIAMMMMAVSPALHPLLAMVLIMDDGGHDNVDGDEDDDVVTFAPSALFNL